MKRFYTLKTSAMFLALCASLSVSAQTFTKDGFTYKITSEESKTVRLDEVNETVKGDVVIPETVEYNDAKYTLKEFEESLFIGRADIYSLVIPGSVSRIPSFCIRELPNLKSVTLSEGLTVIGSYNFQSCTSLESFTIPNSVFGIGGYFLSQCSSLKSVTIGSGLDFIEDYAFWSDESLEVINIPANITELGVGFCNDCASLTAINVDAENTAYSSVDGLLYDKNVTKLITVPGKKESVVLPASVKTIARSSFSGLQAIKTVSLGSVETIEDYAFTNCTNLENISPLPATLKSIGTNAFQNCVNLNCEVEIPAATTLIGEMAFAGTNTLVNLTVNPASETFASKDGIIYNKDFTNTVCSAGGLSEFEIVETATLIKPWTFGYNENLKSIKFSDNLLEVGRAAFYNCTNLESVEFGANFNKVGNEAFNACAKIATVKCKNPTPAAVGWNGFSNQIYANAVLQVPVGAKGNYVVDSAWKLFNIIEEVDFSGVNDVNSDELTAEPVEYYTIDGRKVSADTKGLIVVRYSDGSAKRFIRK